MFSSIVRMASAFLWTSTVGCWRSWLLGYSGTLLKIFCLIAFKHLFVWGNSSTTIKYYGGEDFILLDMAGFLQSDQHMQTLGLWRPPSSTILTHCLSNLLFFCVPWVNMNFLLFSAILYIVTNFLVHKIRFLTHLLHL